jgi:hypothetical protein
MITIITIINIITIIIILAYLIYLLNIFCIKTTYIKYLTFYEFITVTKSSDYFNNMNTYDLQVRKSNNKNEYLKRYQLGYEPFTMEQKKKLLHIVSIINNNINKYTNFKNIKWTFVKIDTHLENSFPHTIENVIILSNNFFNGSIESQINTIIHEKVHIYQRMYPEYINILYTKWGFRKTDININNNRNNPDLKYNYSYNNNLLIQLYNNDPYELYDSNTYLINLENNDKILINNNIIKQYDLPNISISKLEHPNEIMAEIISLYLTNSYTRNDKWIIILKKWMVKYF